MILDRFKAKPLHSDPEVSLTLPNAVSGDTRSGQESGLTVNGGSTKNVGRKASQFKTIALVLIFMTALCSWLTVCQIASLNQWNRVMLRKIESEISELRRGRDASLSTTVKTFPTPTVHQTEGTTFGASSSTTERSQTVEPIHLAACVEPFFDDLRPDATPTPSSTDGYEKFPIQLLNELIYRPKKYYCRQSYSGTAYFQARLKYSYKLNVTVEFESYGNSFKDAKEGAAYEALKCLYPNKTLEARFVSGENWFTELRAEDAMTMWPNYFAVC